MKRVIFLFAVAVLTVSYAQAQFKFGARAGLNLTNWASKYDGKKMEGSEYLKFKPGFQIGVVGEIAVIDNFAIQPGLLFATQGYRMNTSESDGSIKHESKSTLNVNYLQIPVNAQYKLDLGGMKLLLQAGPYFGFAVSGKNKNKFTFDGETENEDYKIDFGTGPEEMNPLDFGLGLGAGMQFGNIQAGLGFNFGLANLNNVDKYTVRNYGLAFTVTYLFGK